MAETYRIVVTGGYGFVGRHIVPALKEHFPKAQIHVLDKDIPNKVASDLASMVTQNHQADITSAQDVRQAFANIKPDAVIHTAGINPPLHERYLRRIEQLVRAVNVQGTANVIDAAQETGCKAFVYTSSCCVVTDDLYGFFANIDERWPVSRSSLMYGESKIQAEKLVSAADGKHMATCVLRPSVTFGEGDPILGMNAFFASSYCERKHHIDVNLTYPDWEKLTFCSSIHTCLYSEGRDTLSSRGRHESVGGKLRAKHGHMME